MNLAKGTATQLQATALNNNHLSVTGYIYDASGNLTNDGAHTYTYDTEGHITKVDNNWVYSYNASGQRVQRRDGNGTGSQFQIYAFFGDLPVFDDDHGYKADYIYAGSTRIAKADNDSRLARIKIDQCSGCSQGFTLSSIGSLNGYQVRTGDKLFVYQSNQTARGGVIVWFIDGTNTNGTLDQDSLPLQDDNSTGWHYRAVSLSGFAGKTINRVDLVFSSLTAVGTNRQIWFRDLVVASLDGAVYPIYTGQTSITTTTYGNAANPSAAAQRNAPAGIWPALTTSFYHGDQLRTARREPSGTVYYYFSDHLGSADVVTDAAGVIKEESDYFPYGGERVLTDLLPKQNHKFTGKERDVESGLDNFGARYYGSNMGRFTSVDPIWVKADRLVDPQRLNLYSYGRNNPLKFTDPTGMDITLGKCTGGDAQKCFAQLQQGLAKEDRSHVHLVTGDGKNGFKKGEFGVTVDADYKSKSGNFQALQKAANDHTATARIDVLSSKDTVTVKVFTSYPQTTPTTSTFPLGSISDSFEGFTFFQYRGQNVGNSPFSAGDYTDVVVHGDQTAEETTATMHHEIRHVLLGDFGRNIPASGHGNKTVDQQTKEAEREAKENNK